MRAVKLDRTGAGRARIGFAGGRVDRVLVVAASTSLRMNCWTGTRNSCEGDRIDDRLPVDVTIEGRG